jgi:ABC-type nitrate/sulfonate/bicarbonate transport system permease component
MGKRLRNFFLPLLLLALILLIWQIFTYTEIIPKWFLSSPAETLHTFWGLITSGTLLKLLLYSFANLWPAFLLALVFSLIFGVILGVSNSARQMFQPFLAGLMVLPTLAWLPLVIIFLGFTRQSIWTVIFISGSVKMIYSVSGAVRGLNPNWLLVAENMGLSRIETIFKVILPGALPQILSGVRIGFGSAWRSLIGAEMLMIAAGGLGKYIWMSQWAFKFDQVLSGVITIAAVGILMEQLVFKRIERAVLVRWGLSVGMK